MFFKGSKIMERFMVPIMVDRWSKFAISVSDDALNLFVYCHNYTMTTVERKVKDLKFLDDSLLLIGHAGSLLQRPFKVGAILHLKLVL